MYFGLMTPIFILPLLWPLPLAMLWFKGRGYARKERMIAKYSSYTAVFFAGAGLFTIIPFLAQAVVGSFPRPVYGHFLLDGVQFLCGVAGLLVCGLSHKILKQFDPGDTHCHQCGFDLHGLPESATVCPECGSRIDTEKDTRTVLNSV